MAKIYVRSGMYIIRSPFSKEEIEEEFGEWCAMNHGKIDHASPSGSYLSIDIRHSTDERLAFLFKAICEFEAIRGK